MSIKNNLADIMTAILIFIFLSTPIVASGEIIKQEKMSFERCLKVIEVSENKLSIPAAISDFSDKKRIANFILSDGKLTIICDGKKGLVTVSTETD